MHRDELTGARRWALALALPSLIGGGLERLLLCTPPTRRSSASFRGWCWGDGALPRAAAAAAVGARAPPAATPSATWRLQGRRRHCWRCSSSSGYGGYFGAGSGSSCSRARLHGVTNIHRMNGVKNWAASA